MRRLLTFTLATLALAGCGDPDAGKLFADIQYGTACPSSNHCEGPADRDICGIAGGMVCEDVPGNTTASCVLTEDGMGNFFLTFSVSQNSGFAMSVSQAVVPAGALSGPVLAGGGNCGVTVSEGVNRYRGDCISQQPMSSTDPAMSVPGCRISDVRFFDDEGNPTIEGRIECRDIPNEANRDLQLDVNAVGTGPTMQAMPGRFRLVNCQGLEIPEP